MKSEPNLLTLQTVRALNINLLDEDGKRQMVKQMDRQRARQTTRHADRQVNRQMEQKMAGSDRKKMKIGEGK